MTKLNKEELEDFINILLDFDDEEAKKEYDFIKEYKRLKNENKLLKEELTNLKNDITRVYNTMISLETINKQELDNEDAEIL